LTALVQSTDHVCCRYRVAALRPHLEAAGHSLTIRPLPSRPWGWVALCRELRGADVVVLQRKLLPGWRLAMLRRVARALVYDVDDAVLLRDSYAPKGQASLRRIRRFAAVVRAADHVSAGNGYLVEKARRWTAGERVHLVPTCVEPARYPLARHARATGGQLVWIGSRSTLQGLARSRWLWETLGWAVPGLGLKLVSDQFLELRPLAVVPCPWSEASEAAELVSADIGVSWIPDDAWSRGKCGLKILQYMAAGLPVIANPVGVQAELVRHGENGFLAATAADWVAAVKRLTGNPELRRQMGQRGRRLVEEQYSLARGAACWGALLDRVDRRRRVA
jgi:glycosyltransferase involved in cell wall biosynthesis